MKKAILLGITVISLLQFTVSLICGFCVNELTLTKTKKKHRLNYGVFLYWEEIRQG